MLLVQDPRPQFDTPVAHVIEALIETLPPLQRLAAASIAVVGLGAHGTAAASVRSLDDVAKSVLFGGKPKRWELGLRPPFFREGDLFGRTVTLVHELLHLDPDTVGALRDAYRHSQRSQTAVDEESAALVQKYFTDLDPLVLAPLAHDGEILVRHWARRPVPQTATRVFDDKDTFLAPVRMLTPEAGRSVWW